MPVIGFNRTFMELKVWMLLRLLALVIKFQSHLYGIESREAVKPLLLPRVFQSHLYGIESN